MKNEQAHIIDMNEIKVSPRKTTLLLNQNPIAVPSLPNKHPLIPLLIFKLFNEGLLKTDSELLVINMNHDLIPDYLKHSLKALCNENQDQCVTSFKKIKRKVLLYSPENSDEISGSKSRKQILSMIRKRKSTTHVIITGFSENIKSEFFTFHKKKKDDQLDGPYTSHSWFSIASEADVSLIVVLSSIGLSNVRSQRFFLKFDYVYDIPDENFTICQ
ncbi:hypothetical protein RF11_07817 [Thelohanellus kitauei]|uniref:Uncharacterized protein n=1 Tax=Thelohanellus kitauei TaxID=669202 RepID=A0A0C2N0K4_THEKT|nr:hypothetical protein RF11_07817 [Thelohanellus kitauei]